MGTGDAEFPLTRLSLLLRVRHPDPETRKEALQVLYASYWKPLYAFLRTRGTSDATAKDLVQGLYAQFVEEGTLLRFDPARGKFRTFLLACLRGHIGGQRDREAALKRAGGRARVPLSDASAPAADPTPEEAYDQAWALAVIERAFTRWRERLRAAGNKRWLPLVDLLQAHGYGKLPPVDELARQLSVTEPQVRHFLHREAKKRLREEILGEVRQGAASDEEADEEVAYLLACVNPPPKGGRR